MIQLLIPSVLLSLIGAFNIFGIKQGLFLNQFLYIIVGFLAYFIVKRIGRNFFLANVKFFYWFFISALIITFIIGFEVRGSRRWLDFYLFNFQASEIFKSFFILFLADFLVKNYKLVNPVKIFLKSFLYFALPTLIIFKQPDLGNAAVYLFIYLMMILFSKLPKKYLLYFLLIIVLVLPVGWHFLHSYQKDRISAFFNPHVDQQGTAYNMTQAIITVGSGKFLGKGLGLGTQSRLLFLPENHTDFAFSSLVEQFGFLGGLVTIILYLIIVFLLISKLLTYSFKKEEVDRKGFLYLIGFLSYFIFQILVNVGMNMGLFPITGIALPFISFGGSSFVALMIGLALIP